MCSTWLSEPTHGRLATVKFEKQTEASGRSFHVTGDLRLKFYHQQQQQQGAMGKQELFNLFVNTGALELAATALKENTIGVRFLLVCDSAKDMELKPMVLRQLFPGEDNAATPFKAALEFEFSKNSLGTKGRELNRKNGSHCLQGKSELSNG